jgi:hypothetical protein
VGAHAAARCSDMKENYIVYVKDHSLHEQDGTS